MEKISDELKFPAKKCKLDQDLKLEPNTRLSDGPVEDIRHPDSDIIKKNVGTFDSKSGPVLHPKIVKSMPGIEPVGNLLHQPDLCVHGTRGLTGCTRCLEAYPAGAINTAGKKDYAQRFVVCRNNEAAVGKKRTIAISIASYSVKERK